MQHLIGVQVSAFDDEMIFGYLPTPMGKFDPELASVYWLWQSELVSHGSILLHVVED